MAPRPSITLKWAENLETESGNFGGIISTVPNRSVVPADVEQTGVLLDEELARQYFNQALYLAGLWAQHLDERFAIGDVHLTISAEDAATISTRLGGTWVQRGTQAIGTITAKVWEKTA